MSKQGGLVLPLSNDHLEYPHRKLGFDNPHYDWDPIVDRNPLRLNDGTKTTLTIIVPLEFFPLTPPTKPFKHPGAMQTPYPDLRHFTVRDYGNRVGVYRLLKAFHDQEIKATFAVNAEIAHRYPPLIEHITREGHEIAAHGVSTAHIHHDNLSRDQEESFISEARTAFPKAVSWMSPARNQSFQTLDLLTKYGFTVNLDWEPDIVPLRMTTNHGFLTALPNYNELSDLKILSKQTEEVWIDQIVEAASYSLDVHGKEGFSAMAFTMTPYIAGQPFRIWAVHEILTRLKSLPDLEIRTAQDSVESFLRRIS